MFVLHEIDAAHLQNLYYFTKNGVAATQLLSGDPVPRGYTRIVMAADIYHNDNAGSHVLQILLISPQGKNVRVGGTLDGTAITNNAVNVLLNPIIIPELFAIGAFCTDAVPAGKFLSLEGFYYDLIR